MPQSLQLECPHCGYLQGEIALICAGCSQMLRREPNDEPASPLGTQRASATDAGASEHVERTESFRLLSRTATPEMHGRDLRLAPLRRMVPSARRRALEAAVRVDVASASAHRAAAGSLQREIGFARIEPWIFLVLGLATVPMFALTPILESMGAFLASVVHELGHAAFAFLCGMPSVPEISLVGHASAIHSDQSLPIVLIIGLSLAGLVWRGFEGRSRWIRWALVAVIYPAIALTDAKELFYLLAGHGAELFCATLCLWSALEGRFTTFKVERLFYGTVGWYLVLRHFALCFSLMRTTEVRAHYAHRPMFVLTNDYLRAAVNVLGCPLENVVLSMLLASLLVLPAAMLLWHLSRAQRKR